MAAEARAESPAPAAPPPPVPEKRPAPEDEDEEERPGTKRRRAFVATLDGVPCAAAAAEEEDGQRDGLSFSFQHARGGFVALETTPKFGSFNPLAAAADAERLEALEVDPKPAPPAAAEQLETLDPKPALPAAEEDSPAVEEEEDPAESPRGGTDREGGNSEVAAAVGDQGEPERHNESE